MSGQSTPNPKAVVAVRIRNLLVSMQNVRKMLALTSHVGHVHSHFYGFPCVVFIHAIFYGTLLDVKGITSL